jgi:hypothetical protein
MSRRNGQRARFNINRRRALVRRQRSRALQKTLKAAVKAS